MKKILLFLCVNLVTSLLCAEQMQFITTLSSPLGTFAQLETADHTAVTSVPLVNFCNTRSAAGTVTLKGANVYLQTLNLKNNTTLGGNTAEFRISNALSVNNDATVTGGRLMANAATVSGASSAKSNVEDTLHMSGMKVKGAKTSSLTIPGQVEVSAAGHATAGEMWWSNANGCQLEEKSEWSDDYVDIKLYISSHLYFKDKSTSWYEASDKEEQKYDIACACAYCFDGGSTTKNKDYWEDYFEPLEECFMKGIKDFKSFVAYAKENDPTSYFGSAKTYFYAAKSFLGGAYGSNRKNQLAEDCNVGDVGPIDSEEREKAYAFGCLDDSKTAPYYCTFWNCKIKEPVSDSSCDEDSGNNTYLLQSRN